MAARVVIAGPNYDGEIPCIEISPSDAGALVDEGLADVTLSFPRAMLAEADPDVDGWWARVQSRKQIMYQPREFTVTKKELVG
jgi:hypothetical protein